MHSAASASEVAPVSCLLLHHGPREVRVAAWLTVREALGRQGLRRGRAADSPGGGGGGFAPRSARRRRRGGVCVGRRLPRGRRLRGEGAQGLGLAHGGRVV